MIDETLQWIVCADGFMQQLEVGEKFGNIFL